MAAGIPLPGNSHGFPESGLGRKTGRTTENWEFPESGLGRKTGRTTENWCPSHEEEQSHVTLPSSDFTSTYGTDFTGLGLFGRLCWFHANGT